MEDKTPKMMPCYRLLIDPNDDNTEVDFISLVEDPAIKIDWFAFSNDPSKKREQEFKFKMQNAEKRMLTGVFMVPEKPIYRIDQETGEEYFVIFTAQDIENAVKKFFKRSYSSNINVEHSEIAPGCYLFDSWFIRDEESNPVAKFGFNNLPVGTWVGTIHVEDENMWNEFVKSGKVKGFSVEGIFKFGKKTMMNTFKTEEKHHTFTDEELRLISDIADFLLDGETEDPDKGK